MSELVQNYKNIKKWIISKKKTPFDVIVNILRTNKALKYDIIDVLFFFFSFFSLN